MNDAQGLIWQARNALADAQELDGVSQALRDLLTTAIYHTRLAMFQAEKEQKADNVRLGITPLSEESSQWLGSACTQTCAYYGCENRATWRRTYKSPQMKAAAVYYHCDEHAGEGARA